MEADVSTPNHAEALDAAWRERENLWRRKLGRLRLGVEPIEEQLARYRRVTWVLTDVCVVLAVIFLTLFGVFGHPRIGLVVIAVLFLPIVLGAWADYGWMASRARRYRSELDRYWQERNRLKAPGASS